MNLNLGGGNTISPLFPQPLSSFQLTSPPSPFFSPTWLTPLPHPVSCWNDDEHRELLSTFSLTPNTLLKTVSVLLVMHSACKTLPSPSLRPPARPPPPRSVWILLNLPRPSRPASNTLPLLLCCGQCTASPFPKKTLPAQPPPQGPCCVGRIAHSTRHVCCSFTLCGGVRLGCVML